MFCCSDGVTLTIESRGTERVEKVFSFLPGLMAGMSFEQGVSARVGTGTH